MKQLQYLRLVQEICYILKLSQSATKTAVQSSQTHQFNHQIMVASSIFLVTKIFEQTRKIRDVLNIIYVCTQIYKKTQRDTQYRDTQDKANYLVQQREIKLNQSQGMTEKKVQDEFKQQEISGQYLDLRIILQKEITQEVSPKYSLQEYNEYKTQILQAQQHLLRIVNYDFSLGADNVRTLKQLLLVLDKLQLSPQLSQIVIAVYNDLTFAKIQLFFPGLIYFAINLLQAHQSLQQNQEQANLKSEQQSDLVFRKKESFNFSQQAWLRLFHASIQDLQAYSLKVLQFYEYC